MSEEVVPFPEILVGDSVRYQFLHGSPQLSEVLQVFADILRLALRTERLGPSIVLLTDRILRETVQRGMYNVELGIESCRMDHPLARSILTLEQNSAGLSIRALSWGCDADCIFQEVPNVCAELQKRLVCSILCLLYIL